MFAIMAFANECIQKKWTHRWVDKWDNSLDTTPATQRFEQLMSELVCACVCRQLRWGHSQGVHNSDLISMGNLPMTKWHIFSSIGRSGGIAVAYCHEIPILSSTILCRFFLSSLVTPKRIQRHSAWTHSSLTHRANGERSLGDTVANCKRMK